ncbi:sensor histidine kinase [Sneathiella glossodoripedis]|uniref:sensor histidine kinase n=1 Tax=Sneathiella glossodoripedis TaxID=418853 RepID=UPI00046F82BD|nr:ATP-binding protein [Sneathiella glossodoripedis]
MDKYGFATFRLKILLPEDHGNLAFYLKRVQDSYRIFVNGKLWMQAGNPSNSQPGSVAEITREFASLKGVKGDLDLVFHISNHSSYAGGGFFNAFTMAERDQYLAYLGDIALDLFLSGSLVCLGIFLVTLHAGRFREKAYFVLYVMAFSAATYVITSNATLVTLFPALSYHWNERIAYIGGTFLIALAFEFIYQVNPQSKGHFFSSLIIYQAALISAAVIFWPTGLPVELIYALGAHLLIVTIACIFEIRQILKTKLPGRWFVIVGIGTLVVSAINDLLYANGLIRSVYIGQFSILLLLFCYGAILALRVNKSIQQNDRLAQAISAMNDSVAIFDSKDHAVLWNEAYEKHLPEAALKILRPGISFADLVRADAYSGEMPNIVGREQDYIRQRKQQHYQASEAFEIQRQSGWYLYREAKTPDGGRIILASDLSKQKTRELELMKTYQDLMAANQSKNSFLSNMSHELRTPLNAINGFSEMMAKQVLGPLNEKYQEYSEHIYRSGQHLLGLVTDMLDVARIETGRLQVSPEHVDLVKLLEGCARMVSDKMKRASLDFHLSIPDEFPSLYADPVRIRQIVLNLLDNAIKFTDKNGQIDLGATVDIDGTTRIFVRDTGIGIAEKDFEIVMQKFGQARSTHLNTHEGLGLGLSIAQVLMQLQGGTLELKSKPGSGTEVTAVFPPKEKAQQFFALNATLGEKGQ